MFLKVDDSKNIISKSNLIRSISFFMRREFDHKIINKKPQNLQS